MKKLFSILLVLALLLSAFALAEPDLVSFTSKKGPYAPTHHLKENAIGSPASINVAANTEGHSMYYQVHKGNGGAASNYRNTSGTGGFSVTYKNDGNGQSLGRTGYDYRLRVAHRTQCSCTSGNASIKVSFVP